MTVTVSGAYNSHDLYQIREAARKKIPHLMLRRRAFDGNVQKHIYTHNLVLIPPITTHDTRRIQHIVGSEKKMT